MKALDDAMEMFGVGGSSSKQDEEMLSALQAQIGTTGNEEFADDMGSSPQSGLDSIDSAKTPLSKEDAEDLQRRLDNLSDEQIQKVFSKMRSSLNSKMADELGDAMKSSKDEMDEAIKAAKLARATSNAPARKLPKADALDPEIRKKYDRELNAIEEELEKIYNDPLGVWQELITDPDKYLSDEEIKKIDGDQEMQ